MSMLNGIQLGDVATWVTGFATLLLFFVGSLQIRAERQSRIASEAEKKTHKIREQAENISSWIAKETEHDGRLWIAVLNQSTRPVYEVIVSLVMIQGSGPHEGTETPLQERACLSVAPPGQVYASIPADYHGMNRHPGIEIAFKDGAGKNWVRKASGDLEPIIDSPVDHYNLERPTGWQFPKMEIPAVSALQVSAWCQEEKGKWILAAKNSGSELIYNCMVYASPPNNIDRPHTDPDEALEILFGTIPPGETLTDELEKDRLCPPGFHLPQVEVEFTDSTGNHWRRNNRGAIKKISHRSPFC